MPDFRADIFFIYNLVFWLFCWYAAGQYSRFAAWNVAQTVARWYPYVAVETELLKIIGGREKIKRKQSTHIVVFFTERH